MPLSITVTPAGHLRLESEAADGTALTAAFADGDGAALLHLGAAEVDTPLPAALAHLRDLGRTFVARVCHLPDAEGALAAGRPELDAATTSRFLLNLPPVRGAEYVDAACVARWWSEMREALTERARRESVESYLRAQSPVWNLVGRVHFNLAENRRDEERPFAFLATYTTGVGARGKLQHAPLGQALREHAGARNREALLSLLAPVSRAAERCAWVKELYASGALYQPLAWTPGEALALLRDVDTLEAAGLAVRVPDAWGGRRPPRATAQVTIGGKKPAGLGGDALLDFEVAATVDGERLTPAELKEVLAATDGLVLLRGRWVEVDREKLATLMERWHDAERAHAEGLPFHEAMRLLAGAPLGTADALVPEGADARVVAGPWLEQALDGLRSPDGVAAADPATAIQGSLRPYQQAGVRWLWWLRSLGLGGCLADDMGLGKTIQVIALLALCRRERRADRAPALVVAPASLVANWRAEVERFAPQLRVLVAHASETPAAELAALSPAAVADLDVVLTTYGTLQRLDGLRDVRWDVVVADEAQAIKNAATKQARAVRALRARTRVALTGTPVENRLADLWSILAFSNPGLLGTEKEFSAFVKKLEAREHDAYGPLRALVRPYILRRMKTQKEVIADLPDKTEVQVGCALTRKQAALYQQSVEALARELTSADGVKRRGIVLAFLTRLKQICNHPSHWLGDGVWDADDSGKLARLSELADQIADRQEKVLVFTQFKEMTAPLAAHLERRFGRPGLVLSGDTAVKARQKLVAQFQADDGPPFFVLSLRAGGTGLNLTAASHVIHFDRWWNPAVEDQATDRAFRIGQKRNVLVHKLVCRGTLEERIAELVETKRGLARQIVEDDGGDALTEMSNDELLRLVSLDVRTALVEGS